MALRAERQGRGFNSLRTLDCPHCDSQRAWVKLVACYHGVRCDAGMRILAALTLFISVSLSPLSSAAPLELKWEFEVNPAQLSTDPLAALLSVSSINNTPSGGCAGRIIVRDRLGEHPVLFVLDQNGNLIWQSDPRPIVNPGYIRMISNGNLVFETPEGPLVSVDLGSGQRQRITASANWYPMTGRYKWPSESLLITNGRISPLPALVVIQRWAPAANSPQLAGSSFGIEDGNLIISWPTTAGQTYQVQRSTDLQAWEDIGVALTGNGTTMSYSQPSNADKVFLRVVIP